MGQGPKPIREPTVPLPPFKTNDPKYLINEFEKFCLVDLGLSDLTIQGHRQKIKRFLTMIDKSIETITVDDVRSYLLHYRSKAPKTYRNQLCSLKVFFRDFLKRGYVVESFKFPAIPLRINNDIPNKDQLSVFYDALPNIMHKAFFLLLASSGLRISELLSITLNDVNIETRMMIPNCHKGSTKHSYITFYNTEAEQALQQYRKEYDIHQGLLFPSAKRTIQNAWTTIAKNVHARISAQMLRRWFCSEMLKLGIQEIYVDAFCGRTPKSVLARHYTDYHPERWKEIYDRANLRVFS